MKSTGKKSCIAITVSQLSGDHMVNALVSAMMFGFLLNERIVSSGNMLRDAKAHAFTSNDSHAVITYVASKLRRYIFLRGRDQGLPFRRRQQINQNRRGSEA